WTCPTTAEPKDQPCVLDDSLGIFVAPPGNGGNDTNPGKKSAPVATITQGFKLAKSNGKRVYVCATATYDEHLVLAGADVAVGGVQAYGGLDCQGGVWTYSGAPAKVAPTSAGQAVKLTSVAASVQITDFELDAAAGIAAGDSSIAMFASLSSSV